MIGVLISGNGSNLRAIISAGIKVDFVGCNNLKAKGLDICRNNNLYYFCKENTTNMERMALSFQKKYKSKLIVCAGYMKILSVDFIDNCPVKIINIHPSLLPSFPGLNAVQQALKHKVKITGVTIHEVDKGIDTGPIITQKAVTVFKSDTVEGLTKRIQYIEHAIYPKVIKRIIQ